MVERKLSAMTAIIFTTVLLALVVYGLQRNHLRQARARGQLAGAANVEDRDSARVDLELVAHR
jgi:hypothetical protein